MYKKSKYVYSIISPSALLQLHTYLVQKALKNEYTEGGNYRNKQVTTNTEEDLFSKIN